MLWYDYMRIFLITTNREMYLKLMETIPNVLSGCNPHTIAVARSAPLAPILSSAPPLARGDRMEDYPSMRFWKRADYIDWCRRQRNLAPIQKKRTADEAFDSDVEVIDPPDDKTHAYLEHKDGQPFSQDDVKWVSRVARSIWTDLQKADKAPKRWGQISSQALTEFFDKMTAHFPDLALCENNWKIYHYATQTYPSWSQTWIRKAKKPKKTKLETKPAHPVEPVALLPSLVNTPLEPCGLNTIGSSPSSSDTQTTALSSAITTDTHPQSHEAVTVATSLLELASSTPHPLATVTKSPVQCVRPRPRPRGRGKGKERAVEGTPVRSASLSLLETFSKSWFPQRRQRFPQRP